MDLTTDTLFDIIQALVHCIINMLKINMHAFEGLIQIDLLDKNWKTVKYDDEISVQCSQDNNEY